MNASPLGPGRHGSIVRALNQLRNLRDIIQSIIGSGREAGVDYTLLEAQSYLDQAIASLSEAEKQSRQR
jgi:hypothetical protein